MSEEEMTAWLEDWYDRWSGPGEPWTMESLAIGLCEAFDITPNAEVRHEYGLLSPQAPDGGKLQGGAHLISDNREHILRQQRRGHPLIQAMQRRKAGEWMPVEQGDES